MFTRRLFAAIVCISIGCEANRVPKNQTVEKTREPIATLDGNVALEFSPDGKWLAIGAELVDTSTWEVTAMLEERVSEENPESKNHWGYTSAAFSPDSKKLALGDQDGSLRILEVPSMELKQEVVAHGARITGIGFGSDDETIITTSVDDLIRIRIWNSQTEEDIRMWNSRLGDEVLRDGNAGSKDQDAPDADVVGGVDIFALSPDRKLFAVADVNSKIVVGSMREGKILHEFKGPNGDQVEMDSLAFSHDSSKLLIGVTPEVYVYKVNGEPTTVQIETAADSMPVYVKAIDESGLIAMFYGDPESQMPVVEFYDLAHVKSIGSFFPHQQRGNYWAASPDGRYIATTGRGGPVRIWDVAEAVRDLSQ